MRKPTLRFETRSAVSSNDKRLIWSTIVAIFGSVGAAAVDSHRRDGALRWCCERDWTHTGRADFRSAGAQHLNVLEDNDIVQDFDGDLNTGSVDLLYPNLTQQLFKSSLAHQSTEKVRVKL